MVHMTAPRLPLRDPPWVDDGFVRRVRTLLRTAPLHDLEAGKAQRDGDWSPYDLRAMALAAIDTVIDHMGLEFGATAAQVRGRIEALAKLAAPRRPHDEAASVATAVLGGLLNDRSRREAFVIDYSDWSGADHRRAQLAFKLLEEVEAPDGTIVLRATDDAVNLFVGALDRDIADAQTAAEAVLAAQVRRGRLDQAVHTAGAARLRSIQFAARVRRVLDTTRHDVRQVDWRDAVPDLLGDALLHLTDRLEVERHVLATVRGLVADDRAGRDGATLLALVEDCQVRHLELHALLLGARTTFLHEQERQRFTAPADALTVELSTAILGPLLDAPAAVAAPATGFFVRAALGPAPPRPLRLTDLVGTLLQPRRDDDGGDLVDTTADLIDRGDDRRFTARQWSVAQSVLAAATVGTGERLSTLLADARRIDADVPELVALSALHAFAPEHPNAPLQATDDGRPLDDPDFAGHDLLVHGAPAADPTSDSDSGRSKDVTSDSDSGRSKDVTSDSDSGRSSDVTP